MNNIKIQEGKEIIYRCINELMEHMPKFAQEHCFQSAFEYELQKENLKYSSEKKLAIHYKNEVFCGFFRADLIVHFDDADLILELKRRKEESNDELQLESYLSVYETNVQGILINFAGDFIKEYQNETKSYITKIWCDIEETFKSDIHSDFTPTMLSILNAVEQIQSEDDEPALRWVKKSEIVKRSLLSKYTISKPLAKLRNLGKLRWDQDQGYQISNFDDELF